MPPHQRQTIWERAARRVRGLERQLHITERSRVYAWGLPLGALAVCFTILVVAGALSGVPPAEFLPVALFEGLVIAGLFVACMMPVAPDSDQGNWGPDPEPATPPPPGDPAVWVALLADSEVAARSLDATLEETHRELAGTRR